jgi:hypothetical protein
MGKFYVELGDELTLYVRHLAWLGTAPKDERPKALAGQVASEPISRMERMRRDGIDPLMPPCPAPHIIAYLMEAGPVETAGMDRVPLSWREIHYWQHDTAVSLEPWEARLLRQLSGEYLSQSRKAEKPDCPAPWGAMTQDHRDAVEKKLLKLFG